MEESQTAQPVRPATLPDLADRLLARIAETSLAGEVVIGGGIALKHYADYRQTQDIDAWWRSERNAASLEEIASAVAAVANESGHAFVRRRFGATDSMELTEPSTGRKVFSFQIAERDVSLEESLLSDWPPVRIETLRENIGAKMNALVNRGAPRDFVDIFEAVRRNLVTMDDCWNLWQAKNANGSSTQARTDVLTLLSRLEQRRPLSSLFGEEHDAAERVRTWFRAEFGGIAPPSGDPR